MSEVKLTADEIQDYASLLDGLEIGVLTSEELVGSVQRLTERVLAARFAGIEKHAGLREGWCADMSAGHLTPEAARAEVAR